MKEVTKDEFYAAIGEQDACVRVTGDYPYTSLFELRNTRQLVGKVIQDYTDGIKNNYPIVSKYYI